MLRRARRIISSETSTPTTRPSGNLLGKQAGQPARAAADVENIIFRSKAHAVEHGKDNRQVILLHALAAARFRPAVEFLTKRFGMSS